MRLDATYTCGVLVVGSGLAGVRAAIAAAEAGQYVLLASAGEIFSGSSFYPGTWGLGLIGPESPEDMEDLADSICTVGRGMADPNLVEYFVAGIDPAIDELKDMGVQLKQAADQQQKDFIPCFDRKHRGWNGLLADSVREVFSWRLFELGVELLPNTELLELTRTEEGVDGAVLSTPDGIIWVHVSSVVLCTGGIGCLYQHRLTTGDVMSTGHALALDAGARLSNMEFMQMMPGYVSPCNQTIFNEKTFRYLQMLDENGDELLSAEQSQSLLEQRSTHGPFTSALADREVDFAILAHQGDDGVAAQYRPEIDEDTPEFIVTYFDWLREQRGLTTRDPFRIAIFAHATNGGICIDENGYTGVPGLYAAGEVTGGMHGADRIGGLSTANGLVFGARAGQAAAASAEILSEREYVEFEGWCVDNAQELQRELQQLMTRYALVSRSQDGLETALSRLEHMSMEKKSSDQPQQIALGRRVVAQLELAKAVLSAQLLRKESRGSHYRSDYPMENPEYNKQIVIKKEAGQLGVTWKDEE